MTIEQQYIYDTIHECIDATLGYPMKIPSEWSIADAVADVELRYGILESINYEFDTDFGDEEISEPLRMLCDRILEAAS